MGIGSRVTPHGVKYATQADSENFAENGLMVIDAYILAHTLNDTPTIAEHVRANRRDCDATKLFCNTLASLTPAERLHVIDGPLGD